MATERRRHPYQAADVYNLTRDRALYEWVAALEAQVAKLTSERDEARGIATSMAEMDSWIAEEAGMLRGSEVGEWICPSAAEPRGDPEP